MARKPSNVEWVGFSAQQIDLLNRLDFYGNNASARTSQLNVLMPILLRECEEAALTLEVMKPALAAVGYGRHALHQLERWESKRQTGVFGR